MKSGKIIEVTCDGRMITLRARKFVATALAALMVTLVVGGGPQLVSQLVSQISRILHK